MKIHRIFGVGVLALFSLGICFAQGKTCQLGITARLMQSPHQSALTAGELIGTGAIPDFCPPVFNPFGSSSLNGSEPGSRSESSIDNAPYQKPAMSLRRVFLNLPGDQKDIWTAPFHLRIGDASWLLPI